MSRRMRQACACLLLVAGLCAAQACGRKAKPEPLNPTGRVIFTYNA